MKFSIIITRQALIDLEEISDQRTREAIGREIDDLETAPDLERRAMSGEYKGYYRVRAAGQRYRVVYAVRREHSKVYVVLVGIRREGDPSDIYEKGKKRLKLYQDKQTKATKSQKVLKDTTTKKPTKPKR